jgi:hypothetical protein
MNIDKAKLTKKYEVQIKAYKELIPCITAAIPVITKFNGKVLNIKLSRALDELTNAYYYVRHDKIDNRNVSIEVQLKQRYYHNSPDPSGYASVSYDFTSNHTIPIILIDGRINAELTIENLKKSIEVITILTAKLENNFANLDNTIAHCGTLCKQVADYNATLDNVNRETLKIDTRRI